MDRRVTATYSAEWREVFPLAAMPSGAVVVAAGIPSSNPPGFALALRAEIWEVGR